MASMTMSVQFIKGSVALLLILTSVVVGCNDQDSQGQETNTIADEDKVSTFELAKKYTAVTDFSERVTGEKQKSRWATPLSLEIQSALESCDGAPILFAVVLQDIWAVDSGYMAVFATESWYQTGEMSIDFALLCNERQKDYIVANTGRDFFDPFAIVATITKFKRPLFEAEVDVDESDPFNSAVVVANSQLIYMYGTLLDIVRVRNFRFLRK